MIYRPTISQRILSFFTSAIVASCIYYILAYPIPDFDIVGKIALTAILFFVLLIAISILTFKIEVTDDAIKVKALLNRKTILFDDIQGYKLELYHTSLILKDGSLGLNIMNKDLAKWVSENFQRLGSEAINSIAPHILKENRYGETPEEKLKKIAYLNKITVGVNLIGISLAIITLITGLNEVTSDFMFIGLCFVFPIFVFLINRHFNGLIPYANEDKNLLLSFSWGIAIPITLATTKMFANYRIIDYRVIFCISLIMILISGFIAFKVIGSNKKIKGLFLKLDIIILSVLYGYGVTVYINCDLDNSKEIHYTAIVNDKYISRGYKSKNYNLEISHWGPFPYSTQIEVSKKLYSEINIGNTLDISLKEGTLGARWYSVSH